MGNRHFRPAAPSGRVSPYTLIGLREGVCVMENRRSSYRRAGMPAARRDMVADWRRWSAAEKSAVVAALSGMALVPLAILSGFLPI